MNRIGRLAIFVMLLIPSKMNIAPIRHGLAYRIEGCLIEFEGKEIPTSRIMYETTPITITADQALAAMDGASEHRSEKSEAIDFLTDALSNGFGQLPQSKAGTAVAKQLDKILEALEVPPIDAETRGVFQRILHRQKYVGGDARGRSSS